MYKTLNPLIHRSGDKGTTGNSERGFTSIELMVVVAIMAILAGLAAPSFKPLIERWRVRQASEALQSTLYAARSEAIKRGGLVAIQKNATGTESCPLAAGNNDWDCGWFVFVDANDDGAFNTNEEILQQIAPVKNVKIDASGSILRIDRYGSSGTSALSFSLYPSDSDNTSPSARKLCVPPVGRIKVIEGSSTC